MFAEMLGKRMKATFSVFLVDEKNRYLVDDTLVFELSDEEFYQLLVAQAEKTLRKMVDKADLIQWGEYERDPKVVLEKIESEVPQEELFIGEIREYWAHDGENEFLMGVVFADPESATELSILTGGTEAEIVSPELFTKSIKGMGFPIRTVQLVSPSRSQQ